MARNHKAGGQLNRTLRGWANYFKVGTVNKAYRALDTSQQCGCVGGCASSTRSGNAGAGLIHSRTSTGTSGSYACAGLGTTCRGRKRNVLSESRMREICMSGSMSGMWKRSHGRTSKAPPDERGGNRYVRPTATAPHLDFTR